MALIGCSRAIARDLLRLMRIRIPVASMRISTERERETPDEESRIDRRQKHISFNCSSYNAPHGVCFVGFKRHGNSGDDKPNGANDPVRALLADCNRLILRGWRP